ncbi:MAG: HlyD family efflux transporter periplasmic adaptor subunit [Clostridia bacterium]|nr:HlyD family efflux transporter periplasmic adaptor subunit [Clostridia bacterium]
MMKRMISTVLALLMTAAPAVAEAFTGTTIARSTMAVAAEADGVLDELYIQPGSAVQAGEVIGRLRTTKVFADQNGTVARIHAKEGKETQGTVLEIAPVSRYTIHCTADSAYDSISSNLVHCGETLYMKCTVNGTHQGTGRVYSIDGSTYMMEATGGEFYVGETVYIYRDAEYAYKCLVGTGTVVSSATETYESEGRITAIHVSEGEYVEKGELLYEVIDGESIEITAPVDGIITACETAGANVVSGQLAASLAPYDEICIAVQLEEDQISQISVGDSAALVYSCYAEERLIPGTVTEISSVAQDGSYTATILPQEAPAQIGLTVEVRID